VVSIKDDNRGEAIDITGLTSGVDLLKEYAATG
jgi:hypothetical protein